MSLPAGVTTCNVIFNTPISFAGGTGTATLTVRPTQTIIWAATGQPLGAFSDTVTTSAQPGSMALPVVDQPGFVDSAGNTVTNWAYTADVLWTVGAQNLSTHKSFQLLTGQTSVTFDLIPDGNTTIAVTAPTATVTSVNGATGPITLDSASVGLSNVDNTSDANKPLSTAATNALALKQDAASLDTTNAGLVNDSASATAAALNATYLHHDAQVIDLCTAYNVSPGDDITTALQSAITTIATSGQSGTIRISRVGHYTLNGALQTGTYSGAEVYTWKGQVLFPAVPYSNVYAPAITIEGAVAPSRGWKFTGDAQGVTITSNITAGFMFDTVPGYDGWGRSWTGIMPVFRNLVLRLSDNPTAGAINVGHALRADIENLAVTTINAWVVPTAGNNSTNVGIVLPGYYENGDVSVRNVDVRGLPSAFRISEHALFDNVQIVGCNVAFISNGGGHYNFFRAVDVEEVGTIFKLESGSTIYLTVMGEIDSETNGTWPTMILADSFGASSSIIGRIDVRDSLGCINQNNALDVTSVTLGNGSGWMARHPSDNFSRSGGNGLNGTAQGAPGYCNPSLHPWGVAQGNFTVTPSSGMTQVSGGGTSQTMLPVLDGKTWGRPRRISGKFKVAASGNRSFALFANRNPDNGHSIYASIYNGNLYLGVGSYVSHATYSATVPAAAASAGATVTLDLEVHYANNAAMGGMRPAVAKVYLNGTLLVSYALTATEASSLALGAFAPYLADGVAFSDSDSSTAITSFVVKDITSTNVFSTGTATLVAGTVSVADARITASSVIRLNRQASGGTLGQLSVALTAGTGFAINSNSSTDTSSVFYEVVSY